MKQTKKILASTDLSELSRTGVCYAVELAESVKATVTDSLTSSTTISYSNWLNGLRLSATFQASDEQFMERCQIALAKS